MANLQRKKLAGLSKISTCASLFALGAAIPALGLAQQEQPGQPQPAQSGQPAQSDQGANQSQNQSQDQNRQSNQAQQPRGGASAQDSESRIEVASNQSSGQRGEAKSKMPNPFAKADDSWISINGTVNAVRPNAFTLNYDGGMITVEMDDADRDSEAYALRMGDKVTVNGLIDDDLFETTTIEASSVYVDKVGRYFFASALDEEDFYVLTYTVPTDASETAVHGLVTGVQGDEFTIDNGVRSIRVDVGEMSYNPLDNDGYQKIEVGDIVRAIGEVDDGFFESREIKANMVTTLVEEVG